MAETTYLDNREAAIDRLARESASDLHAVMLRAPLHSPPPPQPTRRRVIAPNAGANSLACHRPHRESSVYPTGSRAYRRSLFLPPPVGCFSRYGQVELPHDAVVPASKSKMASETQATP